MTSNPYQVGLLVVGGFSAVVAFMLWVVHGQVTDYTTWDAELAGALTYWTSLLVQVFVVCTVGAAVIAGVAWSLRRTAATRAEQPARASEND
jgi:hypothetical protein